MSLRFFLFVCIFCFMQMDAANAFGSAPPTSVLKEHPRWEDMWSAGLPPNTRFDVGCPSPALLRHIEQGRINENARCLVPGCGRGYDVAALAANGKRSVLGLDISETAVKEANEWLSSQNSVPPSQYEVRRENFFDITEQFDFIYDYTFLCALEPSIRESWANQMARVAKPGAEIFTLIFPISETRPLNEGPPFTVSLDLLQSLLEPVGFEKITLEMLPPELCHKGRDGIPRPDYGGHGLSSGLGIWRRKS